MCLIVVPLAGPDFYTERFGIRPLYPVAGTTLIQHVLSNRLWVQNENNQLIFVLRQQDDHTHQMQLFIQKEYPRANTVVLSNLTSGAPFSVLAGVALSKQLDKPVIVDLADIAFSLSLDPECYFGMHQNVDAIVPYFSSNDPKFSYLKLNGSQVEEAREKQVISQHASAGVYIFRNVVTYLKAISFGIENPNISTVNSTFFVCPLINGLISSNRQVHGIQIDNVDPVSAIFNISSGKAYEI